MADAQQSVQIVFTTSGVKNTQQLIERLDDSIRDIIKNGNLSADEVDHLRRATKSMGDAAGRAATANQANAKSMRDTASATGVASKATGDMAGNLPRLRYALYDVSSTLTYTGAAMAGLATATVATSISMDRNFADVVRTTGTYLDSTGQATANLRDEFNSLYSSIPTSWADLTDIGTLAGQLGVATENVAEFSSLVAKFSAVTDVSVNDSATAFGRLSELLNVSAAEYENLGSSIAAAGVSSVATESQIINISSQIASMGAFVGMSADEVIGLSSALASLGVQPELSRGVITRLFTNITEAISDGGEELDAFGRVAGTTGAQFAQAWGDNASQALYDFLDGLGRVEESQSVAVLKELGITASRDIPTILKLAQNSGLLAEQLQIASDGYSKGTALQEQYGVIAETVAAKLEVLKNNFSLLVSALGEASGVIGPLIDGLTSIVRGMTVLAGNDIVQGIGLVVVGLTALAGVTLVMAGAAARGAGGLLALRTALVDVAGSAYTAKTGLDASKASMLGLVGASKALKAALISTGVIAALVAIGSAVSYFIGQASKAKEANQELVNSFKSSIAEDSKNYRETGEAVELYSVKAYQSVDASANAAQEATNLANELNGVEPAASNAANAVEEYTVAVDAATEAATRAALQDWLLGEGTGEEQLARVQQLTQGLEILGFTFDDFVNAIQTNDTQWITDAQIAAQEKFTQASEASSNAAAFMSSETGKALIAVAGLADESENQSSALLEAVNATQAATQASDLLGTSLGDTGGSASDAETELNSLSETASNLGDAAFSGINGLIGLNQAVYDLGNSLYENGGSFDAYSQAGRENLGALQSAFSAAADAAGGDSELYTQYVDQILAGMVGTGQVSVAALASLANQGVVLGNSFVNVGNKVNQVLASIQRGIQSATAAANTAIAAGADNVAARNLATVGRLQAQQKYFEGDTIDYIKRQATEINKTNPLLDQMGTGWQNAGNKAASSGSKQSKAAKDVSKEVRTLSDYVSDLSSVFSDAFDFRFGLQQSKDAVSSSISDMRQRFDDIRESIAGFNQDLRDGRAEIRGLKADLTGLASERSILEHHLSIATNYGDSERAQAIQAELAKNAADTAEKQNSLNDAQADLRDTTEELRKAQADLVPDLTSGTESAQEQREAVLDLIQAYQEQIQEFANTGASQTQVAEYSRRLRSEFESQLRQLGYNTREVKSYSNAFKDFTTIINNVPRNVTISAKANMDPAKRALAEFQAATKSAKSSVDGLNGSLGKLNGYSGKTFKVNYDDDSVRKAGLAQEYLAQIFKWNKMLQSYGGNNPQQFISEINKYRRKLEALGSYSGGGFTGRGGKYDPAGTVHRGEYVVPKEGVNQATGLPYADYFQRLSRGVPSTQGYANGGFVSPAPQSGVVRLDAMSIQQLAAAIPQVLMMNGKMVGQVTSQQYARGTRRGSN